MAPVPPLTNPSAVPWPPLPHQLRLGAGEVHVLCASLELSEPRLRGLARTLSPEELDRAARFHARHDKDRFVARRGLLRELLGQQAQAAPGCLVFSSGPFGKPALTTPAGDRPLHFSVAHSDTMAVFAMSCEGELGVDIERVRELPDLPALISTICSDREQEEWPRVPEDQRLQAFFNIWTRKEAFLKGIGLGLSKPPREIEVPWHACEPDQSLPVFDQAREFQEWSLRSLSIREFALAAALRHPPKVVRCWEWYPEQQP
jgi:4'-phosphopantetheinyl transferase